MSFNWWCKDFHDSLSLPFDWLFTFVLCEVRLRVNFKCSVFFFVCFNFVLVSFLERCNYSSLHSNDFDANYDEERTEENTDYLTLGIELNLIKQNPATYEHHYQYKRHVDWNYVQVVIVTQCNVENDNLHGCTNENRREKYSCHNWHVPEVILSKDFAETFQDTEVHSRENRSWPRKHNHWKFHVIL